MTETLLQHISTNLTLMGVLQVPPLVHCLGCIICTSKQISCKHDNKFHTYLSCTKSGFCSCLFNTDALCDIKDCVFKEIYSCMPFIQLHEQSFKAANNLITSLTLMLQQAHKLHSAAFANIINVLAHIEENHNTKAAMEKWDSWPATIMSRRLKMPSNPKLIEEPAPLSPAVDNKSLFFNLLKTGNVFKLVLDSDDAIVVLDSLNKLENILHSGPFTSSEVPPLIGWLIDPGPDKLKGTIYSNSKKGCDPPCFKLLSFVLPGSGCGF
ncbi:hypothetical protein EDD18DRAFT_1364268 [Armillaria luteobubalina]|uniref:Uncharacterized protein n=1 Tax=Armillaria luteobubalina TaxID=153913 RepID=A0AA39P863_9AGAR|nr:hypothetical protein EDD18DRAFT_1364268 [Armillaria luteobubalina]